MPDGMARFIEACIDARVNVLIAGGTSTGKTTLMRVLCGMVPASEHLVVVEDGAELHLDQDRGDGHPWHALDSVISMGASMGMALGLDKGRAEADKDKKIIAVIGDSTFMHMGMQGLLDITYNGGNVTVLLLDNRTVGMTGGQDNPGSGRDIYGNTASKVDFVKICEALGVKPERIRKVDPYQLPVLFKALREETRIPEPSVIITDRPCVLIGEFKRQPSFKVEADKCTGCGSCIDVGCPAISVQRTEAVIKPNGKEVLLQFTEIETAACTGCGLCLQPCAPEAIVSAVPVQVINFTKS